MKKKKKNKALVIIASTAVTLLTLAGCADPTSPDEIDKNYTLEWVATGYGDLYCATTQVAYGFTTYDCDWSTLTDGGTHVTENDPLKPVAITVEDGEVRCITYNLSHGKFSLDCDWESVTPVKG